MVKNWYNVLSMEDVTVRGHHPECRVTRVNVLAVLYRDIRCSSNQENGFAM